MKFAGFFARFRQLLSLLQESRYVEEMMFYHLLFTKLQLLKNLKKMLINRVFIFHFIFIRGAGAFINDAQTGIDTNSGFPFIFR